MAPCQAPTPERRTHARNVRIGIRAPDGTVPPNGDTNSPSHASLLRSCLSVILAFVLTFLSCPLVLAGLRRWEILDVPGERSSHARPTPRGGGLAPAIGASIAAIASSSFVGPARVGTLVIACAYAASGLVEDVIGVPVVRRLLFQVAIALLSLPWLLSSFDGARLWLMLIAAGTVLWLVSYVNAFNFMDGINGLSVAQASLAGGCWWIIGCVENLPILGAGSLLVAAAAIGFAPFNFPRARMFLGDTGSYFFGGWLAALAVVGLSAGVPPEAVVAPLSLYLADTAITLIRRFRRGEKWFHPHRDHTYQRLVQLGWSHARTTLFVGGLMLATSGFGALSLVGPILVRVVGDILLVGVLVAYVLSPEWLTSRGPRTPRIGRV